ncbi:MFS transporter [Pseudaminobacter arsenicus]|uniref:MFS transporter n=1 Tax=Borborobacter arsenicus TaxID=1851146 RepID=A0A432V3I1_9HYPH|nr:MFS transporter [Pseudaminobacter arsenicus]RUM96764.1 MFS transporter [Pseudaminobacter arsenicus]
MNEPSLGIIANRDQFSHQLLQVLLIGLTIGMVRTVIPALAESEFEVARGSMVLLASFVVAFGVVKGALNFVAGRLSEQIGRKPVLLAGWVAAFPIPYLIYFAPDWSWIVAATVLLGVNQGLCWSMSQTAKLDFTRPEQRGLTLGLNEFAGYAGVAIAGVATAYLTESLGMRTGLLVFGIGVIGTGTVLTIFGVRETLRFVRPATAKGSVRAKPALGTWDVFALMSWRDRRLAALSQAGLVEKFVDALIWVVLPVHLFSKGVALPQIGWIAGIYGVVWGVSQLVTGPLSDRIGRYILNVGGMWICTIGTALMVVVDGPWGWTIAAAIAGFGMAMLYPNLSAAVADLADPTWRGSAIGIYRFWRDLGYAVGALGLGLTASLSGSLDAAFWFVAFSMLASGALLAWWGEESHPGLSNRR